MTCYVSLLILLPMMFTGISGAEEPLSSNVSIKEAVQKHLESNYGACVHSTMLGALHFVGSFVQFFSLFWSKISLSHK